MNKSNIEKLKEKRKDIIKDILEDLGFRQGDDYIALDKRGSYGIEIQDLDKADLIWIIKKVLKKQTLNSKKLVTNCPLGKAIDDFGFQEEEYE